MLLNKFFSFVCFLLFATTLGYLSVPKSISEVHHGIDVHRTKDCPSNSILVGKVCVSTDFVEPKFVCSPATVSLNGDCVSFARGKHVCPAEFSLSGDHCVQVEKLLPSIVCERGELVHNGCRVESEVPPVCPLEFELLNGQCVRFAPPSYVCPSGIENVGDNCVKRTSTEAAPECPSDFTLDGKNCTKYVTVPPTCSEGFTSVETECIRKVSKVDTPCPDEFEPANYFCEKSETSPARLMCPPDFVLDAEDDCVKEVPISPTCPTGSVREPTGQCEGYIPKEPVCEDSEVLIGMVCRSSSVTPSDLICPDGYSLVHDNCKKVHVEDPLRFCSIGVLEGDHCVVDSTAAPRVKCPAGYEFDQSYKCVRDVTYDCSKPAVRVECNMPSFVADLASPSGSLRRLQVDYKAKHLSQTKPSKLPDCSFVEYTLQETCVKVEYVAVEEVCTDGSAPVGRTCKTVLTREAEFKCKHGHFDKATGKCVTIHIEPHKVMCSVGVLQPDGSCLEVTEREAAFICPSEYYVEDNRCVIHVPEIHHPNRIIRQIPQAICDVGEVKGKVCVELVEKLLRGQICPAESEDINGDCIETRPLIFRSPFIDVRPVVYICPHGTVLSGMICIKTEEFPAERVCPADSVFDESRCRFTAELQYLPPEISFYPARSVCPPEFNREGNQCCRTITEAADLQCPPGFIRFKQGHQECVRSHEPVLVCPEGAVRQGKRCVKKTYTPPRITEVKICTKGEPGC